VKAAPTRAAGWLRLRGAAELAPGAAVVGVVALLFVPVGPGVIDVLLAASLGISASVLLATLLAPDALRLSAFPALLLLTTLLRLCVAVGSTRLVLTRGEAGRVVEALGRVLVQGNWVAGAVVYAILALVQLLVIAKGAERVAEVAARFTLDALPGKQMAIDAELRAGAIDAAEAGRRRRALEQESQLRGAMDGALRFVKGDAVAGIAIALVNSLGGFASGLQRGMTPGASARRYVLLAVGDGLASQIPALLLAVAAGISVTRTVSDERSLSSHLARELAAEPRALLASAVLLAALGLAPGLPAAPFLSLAAVLGATGWMARRPRGAAAEPRPAAVDPPGTHAPQPSVVVEMSPELLGSPDPSELQGTAAALKGELWRSTGVPIGSLAVTPAPLRPGSWRVVIEGAQAASGLVALDRALCLVPPDELRLAGLASAPGRHPLTGAGAALVAIADADRARALGDVLDPPRRALAEANAALRRSAHLLVGVQEVQALLDSLEPSAPALVREVARQLPPAVLGETLRRLLEEGVSILPLRVILDALLSSPAGSPAPVLAEACRRSLSRHIAQPLLRGRSLEALLLDPGAELVLRDALHGDVAALSPARARGLVESVESGLAAAPHARALLAPTDVRRPLRNLLAQRFPELAVLGYDELPPDLPVRPVGRAAFSE
jgi:type III secretion protein V